MPPGGFIVKALGSGIGLAREAMVNRSKTLEPTSTGESSASVPTTSTDEAKPPAYQESEDSREIKDTKDGEDEDDDLSDLTDEESDGEVWALDEAQPDLPPSYEESNQGDKSDRGNVEEIMRRFMVHHPPTKHTALQGQLPYPVILPQRRPGTKARGFVHAYALMLNECGVDQQTFLDFLKAFDKAIQANPVFTVITVAANIAGFAPSPIAMGVSIGVQVINGTVKEVTTRIKTNKFLDEMNRNLFQPRGLFAMIMTFKPNQQPGVEALDLNKTIANSLIKSTSGSSSRKVLYKVRVATGVSKGEVEIPEAAPLIFPALDALPMEQKQNAMKRTGNFIAEYYDRRAQATYAAKNPDSKLKVAPDPQFASRYSDPNHPANSGSIISLVTGGKINPQDKKREKRSRRQEKKALKGERRLQQGRNPSRKQERAMEGVRTGSMGMTKREWREKHPEKAGPLGKVKHALKQDVLYLLVVNMPSQEEVEASAAEIEAQDSE